MKYCFSFLASSMLKSLHKFTYSLATLKKPQVSNIITSPPPTRAHNSADRYQGAKTIITQTSTLLLIMPTKFYCNWQKLEFVDFLTWRLTRSPTNQWRLLHAPFTHDLQKYKKILVLSDCNFVCFDQTCQQYSMAKHGAKPSTDSLFPWLPFPKFNAQQVYIASKLEMKHILFVTIYFKAKRQCLESWHYFSMTI